MTCTGEHFSKVWTQTGNIDPKHGLPNKTSISRALTHFVCFIFGVGGCCYQYVSLQMP